MVKWSSGLLCHRGKQFYTLASIVRLHADADGCSQMDDRTDGRTDILCGTTPLLFMLIFCELKNGRVESGEVGGAVVGRILLVLLDGLCCGSFVSLLCMSEILKS